jgi:hypothetical protein
MFNYLFYGSFAIAVVASIWALYRVYQGDGEEGFIDASDVTLLAAGMESPSLGVAAYTAGACKCGDGGSCDCGGDCNCVDVKDDTPQEVPLYPYLRRPNIKSSSPYGSKPYTFDDNND